MVSKFTEKDLAKMEAEAELLVYKTFQTQNAQLGLPTLSSEQERQILLGNERCSPLIWNFFERVGPSVKQRLFTQAVFTAILSESEIDRFELVCNNLAQFFSGSQSDAGTSEKMAYKNFCYYRDLSVEAMRFFFDHFARQDYFGFSSSAYQQWFASLRLGLYSGSERCLNGAGSLNYPDLRNDPSPRLQSLQQYLEVIYQLRVKVQLLDLLIRNREHAGTSPNISMGQWERFINSTRSRLNSKFGTTKGSELFRRMFGSDNPTAPTSQQDFNQVQNEVLDKISQAILAEQLGQDWAPQPPQPTDGFHRDYAQEQQEREEREKQNKERKERENLNWANINPTFNNNPNLVKQWTDKDFTYEQTKEWIDIGLKPTESEFTAYLVKEKKLTPEQMLNTGDKEQLQSPKEGLNAT